MSDDLLVEKVLSGDQKAFGDLVERHQRWVTVVALRATGNLATADDLAQDTFLRAFRALTGWRREASFRTWIGRILQNRIRDWARSEKVDAEPVEAAKEIAVHPVQERQLLDEEMLQALRRAYDEIPAGRQREVVRMRYIDGKSLEQIATALGLRVGTVKAHLFRGTTRLREMLAGSGAGRI